MLRGYDLYRVRHGNGMDLVAVGQPYGKPHAKAEKVGVVAFDLEKDHSLPGRFVILPAEGDHSQDAPKAPKGADLPGQLFMDFMSEG